MTGSLSGNPMGIQQSAAILLLACFVVGCGTINNATVPQPTLVAATIAPTLPLPTPTSSIQRELPMPAMPKDVQSGPIPGDLDPRLDHRDTQSLPPEALIKFQRMNRGKNPKNNYRWVLYSDGRWFLATNSGADLARDTPFDTELPTKPTKTLPANLVEQIKKALVDANFATLSPYFINPKVDDGSFSVISARIDGKVHEVIYEAYQPPYVELLADVVTNYR